MTNSPQASADTRTETRVCERHGEYEAELFRIMERWMGGHCPKCDEELRGEQEEFKRRQEAQAKQARIDRMLNRSGIPLQ